MASFKREVKTMGKDALGLTTDVLSLGLTILGGTAKVARNVVQNTTVENVQNVATYTADVVAGNEIGTLNAKIEEAKNTGDFTLLAAEWALDAIHGDANFRKAVESINREISEAESKLEELELKAELIQMKADMKKEVEKLNKESLKLGAQQAESQA